MFCQNANFIAPLPEHRGEGNTLLTDTNGDGRHDVILEKDDSGNTYLHLVVPAAAVNFLNGSDGSSLFDFGDSRGGNPNLNDYSYVNGGNDDGDYENVFVELGCKVYEVNKVSYKGLSGKDLQAPL